MGKKRRGIGDMSTTITPPKPKEPKYKYPVQTYNIRDGEGGNVDEYAINNGKIYKYFRFTGERRGQIDIAQPDIKDISVINEIKKLEPNVVLVRDKKKAKAPAKPKEDYHFWHEDAEAIHKETGKIPKKNPYNNDGDDDLVWYDPNDEDAGMRFRKSKKFDKPYYVRLANGSIEYNGKGNKHKFHYYQ